MGKKIARWARLVRDISGAAVAILTVIKLIVEIADKAANCNVRTFVGKLPIQI
jgi:hypothetical protein